eukprot:ANDGO_04843.mRNA.1 hypothetical protein
MSVLKDGELEKLKNFAFPPLFPFFSMVVACRESFQVPPVLLQMSTPQGEVDVGLLDWVEMIWEALEPRVMQEKAVCESREQAHFVSVVFASTRSFVAVFGCFDIASWKMSFVPLGYRFSFQYLQECYAELIRRRLQSLGQVFVLSIDTSEFLKEYNHNACSTVKNSIRWMNGDETVPGGDVDPCTNEAYRNFEVVQFLASAGLMDDADDGIVDRNSHLRNDIDAPSLVGFSGYSDTGSSGGGRLRDKGSTVHRAMRAAGANAVTLERSKQIVRETEEIGSAEIQEIQLQLDVIQSIAMQNIESVLQRGDKLDALEEKTVDISVQAHEFHRHAKKQSAGAGRKLSLVPVIVCCCCCILVAKYGNFRWHSTFMRLTLLKPRVVFWSLLFLPLASVLGVFLAPVVGLLMTVMPDGRSGMFQHAKENDVTVGVWTAFFFIGGVFAYVCNVPSIYAAVAAPSCCVALIATGCLWKESAMFLRPLKPHQKIKVRSNLSNCIGIFSLCLEYVQLMSLAVLSVSFDVSLNANLVSVTGIVLRPFGSSVMTQFIIACVIAAVLLGFLAITVLLTSQSEKRVARVTEQQEREGNLAWLKQLISLLSDTAFMSVVSAFSAEIGQLGDTVASSDRWNNDSSLYWARCVLQVVLFAYCVGCLLVVLPIQAVFPDIWLPPGQDVRAAPLFSLAEKGLKIFLITSLPLAPNIAFFRTGVAVSVFALLALWMMVFPQPMTHGVAKDIRLMSIVNAAGIIGLLYIPESISLPATLSWLGFGWLAVGVSAKIRSMRHRRIVKSRQEKLASFVQHWFEVQHDKL